MAEVAPDLPARNSDASQPSTKSSNGDEDYVEVNGRNELYEMPDAAPKPPASPRPSTSTTEERRESLYEIPDSVKKATANTPSNPPPYEMLDGNAPAQPQQQVPRLQHRDSNIYEEPGQVRSTITQAQNAPPAQDAAGSVPQPRTSVFVSTSVPGQQQPNQTVFVTAVPVGYPAQGYGYPQQGVPVAYPMQQGQPQMVMVAQGDPRMSQPYVVQGDPRMSQPYVAQGYPAPAPGVVAYPVQGVPGGAPVAAYPPQAGYPPQAYPPQQGQPQYPPQAYPQAAPVQQQPGVAVPVTAAGAPTAAAAAANVQAAIAARTASEISDVPPEQDWMKAQKVLEDMKKGEAGAARTLEMYGILPRRMRYLLVKPETAEQLTLKGNKYYVKVDCADNPAAKTNRLQGHETAWNSVLRFKVRHDRAEGEDVSDLALTIFCKKFLVMNGFMGKATIPKASIVGTKHRTVRQRIPLDDKDERRGSPLEKNRGYVVLSWHLTPVTNDYARLYTKVPRFGVGEYVIMNFDNTPVFRITESKVEDNTSYVLTSLRGSTSGQKVADVIPKVFTGSVWTSTWRFVNSAGEEFGRFEGDSSTNFTAGIPTKTETMRMQRTQFGPFYTYILRHLTVDTDIAGMFKYEGLLDQEEGLYMFEVGPAEDPVLLACIQVVLEHAHRDARKLTTPVASRDLPILCDYSLKDYKRVNA